MVALFLWDVDKTSDMFKWPFSKKATKVTALAASNPHISSCQKSNSIFSSQDKHISITTSFILYESIKLQSSVGFSPIFPICFITFWHGFQWAGEKNWVSKRSSNSPLYLVPAWQISGRQAAAQRGAGPARPPPSGWISRDIWAWIYTPPRIPVANEGVGWDFPTQNLVGGG